MSKNVVWNIKQSVDSLPDNIKQIAKDLGILLPTAALLDNRGFKDSESASNFIKNQDKYFSDPFLLPDMDKAVNRIIEAINKKEKIVIYGDYDVDGVTSVSTLYLYLKSKGAVVDYYIPSRTGEGYGISIAALDMLSVGNYNLLITVDTGITAIDETEYAKKFGIDVIITDHHECHAEIPKAIAIVNPRRPDSQYPFKELAGVGVVFNLICSIEYILKGKPEDPQYLKDICMTYGDLVAIGTVADVMPLVDENRLIVSLGLKLIENTERQGLKSLLEYAGVTGDKYDKNKAKKKITSSLIGYVIAPRLNAAGRISNASRAVELFLTDSKSQADALADELCNNNRERQAQENLIIEKAYKKIEEEHDFENDSVIVLADNNWHHGVIGIVASRITEHYGLPCILISFDGDVGKGSGRSVKGLNLVDALSSCDDILIKYGGHELAAGLSISQEHIADFKKRINDYARDKLDRENMYTSMDIDCVVNSSDITLNQVNELYYLEPYGVANPVPVFALCDAVVEDIVGIGNNRHTKLILSKDRMLFTAIKFGTAPTEYDFYAGDKVDIAFNLEINNFQGVQNVQMIVRGIKKNKESFDIEESQKQLYNDIKNGDKSELIQDVVPTHDDFAEVYRYIINEIRKGNSTVSVRSIEHRFRHNERIGYVKIKFIIDIFRETNVIGIQDLGDDRYTFKQNYTRQKVNLDKSSIYKRLKSRAKTWN